ncbi:hypothetical protein L686_18675 [Stutzerimonas stutzeri MF28]|nr:hypothetical protein L686_18675 [Stutzerimonas stutzeri MF28]
MSTQLLVPLKIYLKIYSPNKYLKQMKLSSALTRNAAQRLSSLSEYLKLQLLQLNAMNAKEDLMCTELRMEKSLHEK